MKIGQSVCICKGTGRMMLLRDPEGRLIKVYVTQQEFLEKLKETSVRDEMRLRLTFEIFEVPCDSCEDVIELYDLRTVDPPIE